MVIKYSGFLASACLFALGLLTNVPVSYAQDTTTQTGMAAEVAHAPEAIKEGVVCLLPDRFHRNLDGTFWHLDKLQNEVPPANLDITLTFHNGTVAGYAGCNSYAGTFVNPTDTLFGIKNLEATKRKCEQAVCPTFAEGGTWEEKYLALLPKTAKVERTSTELKLFDTEGKQILGFKALKAE